MPIKISPADVTHAPLLAEIHTSAFSTNRIMRKIYPTAAIWTAFQSAVEKRMRRDIADERTNVIVARVSNETGVEEGKEEGDIVGFAVWCYFPGEEKADGKAKGEETYKAPQWSLPEGTDWTVLTPWKNAAAQVAEAVIGNREHYGIYITTPPFCPIRALSSSSDISRTHMARRIIYTHASRHWHTAAQLGSRAVHCTGYTGVSGQHGRSGRDVLCESGV